MANDSTITIGGWPTLNDRSILSPSFRPPRPLLSEGYGF
jgi:hypothetical protein